MRNKKIGVSRRSATPKPGPMVRPAGIFFCFRWVKLNRGRDSALRSRLGTGPIPKCNRGAQEAHKHAIPAPTRASPRAARAVRTPCCAARARRGTSGSTAADLSHSCLEYAGEEKKDIKSNQKKKDSIKTLKEHTKV